MKKARETNPDLKVSTMLLEGRPTDMIVKTANEGGFDLIVMGSRVRARNTHREQHRSYN